MSGPMRIRIVATLACCWLSLDVHAAEPPALENNPFSRPPSERLAIESPAAFDSDGADQPLELLATMVGGSNRLANVGGRVIRPGDEIFGYLLVQVNEDHAIFSRNGNRRTIYVKPDLLEDDD